MRGPPRARGTVSRCESSGLLTTENTDWIDTGSFGGGAERPRPSINRGARAAKGGVAEAQQGGHMLWPGLASRLCGPRRWRGASPAPHLLDFKQQGQPAGSHQLPTHCPPSPAFSASARAAPLPRAHHLQQTTPWRPHPNTQEGEMKAKEAQQQGPPGFLSQRCSRGAGAGRAPETSRSRTTMWNPTPPTVCLPKLLWPQQQYTDL